MLMRGFVLCAATLTIASALCGPALAQAPADDPGAWSGGNADALNRDDGPLLAPPRPYQWHGLGRRFAAPPETLNEKGLSDDGSDQESSDQEGLSQEGLGKDGQKPAAGLTRPPALTARPPGGKSAQRPVASQAGQLKRALAPKPPPEALRKQMLDALFLRLRQAGDPEEARRIAESIERLWLNSPSDTANLLMQRATASAQAQQYELALSLLDKLVLLNPDWAEAWNQRATARFLTGDLDGAMADINQVVKLEPRHFAALAGMGVILQAAGLDKSALEIFNKVLALYPLEPEVTILVQKLTLEIEGEDI